MNILNFKNADTARCTIYFKNKGTTYSLRPSNKKHMQLYQCTLGGVELYPIDIEYKLSHLPFCGEWDRAAVEKIKWNDFLKLFH